MAVKVSKDLPISSGTGSIASPLTRSKPPQLMILLSLRRIPLLVPLVSLLGFIPPELNAEENKSGADPQADPLVKKLVGAWVPNEAAFLKVILDQAGVTDGEVNEELKAKLEQEAKKTVSERLIRFGDDLTLTMVAKGETRTKEVKVLRVREDEKEIDADLVSETSTDNVTFELDGEHLIIKTRGRNLNRIPALKFDRIDAKELEKRLAELEQK